MLSCLVSSLSREGERTYPYHRSTSGITSDVQTHQLEKPFVYGWPSKSDTLLEDLPHPDIVSNKHLTKSHSEYTEEKLRCADFFNGFSTKHNKLNIHTKIYTYLVLQVTTLSQRKDTIQSQVKFVHFSIHFSYVSKSNWRIIKEIKNKRRNIAA